MTPACLARLGDVAAACVALRAAPGDEAVISRLDEALTALRRQREVEAFVRSDAYRELRAESEARKTGG